jgi:ABC-type transporter Mla subunit MlaD
VRTFEDLRTRSVTFYSQYTRKSSDRNSDAVRRLETTIVDAINNISGQIQGLEISAQTVSDFAVQRDGLLKALEDHNKALTQCLKACTSALDETAHKTGSLTFKYAKALDDARQLIAATVGNVNTGGGTVEAGTIIAQDRADQMVAQSVAHDVALSFFALRKPRREKSKNSSSLPT